MGADHQDAVFPQLDIIILTEHHLSAKFRPTYIVESGWDILMVAGPPKHGHLRHIDRRGVAFLWKSSANWEVKQEIVSDHTSHQSAHQCATWTIKSKQFSHPIHITRVSPNGTGTEDFYHTLQQQNKFPDPSQTFSLAILTPTSRKNKKKHH
jgi:hypothetical protein